MNFSIGPSDLLPSVENSLEGVWNLEQQWALPLRASSFAQLERNPSIASVSPGPLDAYALESDWTDYFSCTQLG